MKTIVCYGFNPHNIRTKDPSRFLRRWWPEEETLELKLREAVDRFAFHVSGYDTDPREVFRIPEVRDFYQAFRQLWPFWFLGCNLALPNLLMMSLCCLRAAQVTGRKGTDVIRMDFDASEMKEFIEQELGRMEVHCRLAGMTPEASAQRRCLVLDYFLRDWDDGSQWLPWAVPTSQGGKP